MKEAELQRIEKDVAFNEECRWREDKLAIEEDARSLIAEVRRLLPMEERLAEWEHWSASIDNAPDDEVLESPVEPYLTIPPS